MTSCFSRLGERRTITLLCFINFMLYVNRGIIPGAPESFDTFISNSLGVSLSQQNFYLGLLQSLYVASVALLSIVFGFLSLSYRPFLLIGVGLGCWVIAAGVSGIAYNLNSYYVLAIGRVISGAGEAAFQCNAIPFINRHAPQKNAALWLGLCIASFTVGNAVGYVYGSSFASSSLTWAGAFYSEGVLMLPAMVLCFCGIREDLNAVPVTTSTSTTALLTDHHAQHEHDLSFVSNWLRVFTNVPFALVAFGYGAYTFTMGCFATFTPTLLIGLGFFKDENEVSTVFGAIIVVCGTIGTLVGGIVLDKLTHGNTLPQEQRSKTAVSMIFVLISGALISGSVMTEFTSQKAWFVVALAVVIFFMTAIVPAENVAVMEMFPESRQPMAFAANMATMAICGDVPAPVVLGWLKDTWAPLCGTIEIDGKSKLNPECHLDHSGLHTVLLFSVLWIIWAVLLWGTAMLLVRRRSAKTPLTIQSPAFRS